MPARHFIPAGASLACALAIFGCERQLRVVSSDLPTEEGYVAVLVEDENGALESSTALLQTSGGHVEATLHTNLPEGGRVWILQYRAFTLEDVRGFDGASGDELLAYTSGPPELPAPDWWQAGMIEDGSYSKTTAPGPPKVTASWLPRCKDLIPEGISPELWLNCESHSCRAAISETGCTLRVTTEEDCTFAQFSAAVGSDGSLEVASDARRGTCRSKVVDGSYFSLTCEGGSAGACRLGAATLAPPSFQIDEVELVDPMPATELAPPPSGGQLFGVAIDGRHIAVAVQEGSSVDWGCSAPLPSKVVVLDRDSLELLATTTVAPCLRAITADPSGGFLLSYGLGAPRLARLSSEGARVADRPIEGAGLLPTHQPVAIAANERAIVVLLRGRGRDDPAFMARFDRESLAPLDVEALSGPDPVAVFAHPTVPENFWILSDNTPQLFEYEDNGSRSKLAVPLGAACGITASQPRGVTHLFGVENVLVISDGGDYQRVFFVRAGAAELCAISTFPRESYVPVLVARWPADPMAALVGLSERADGTGAALLALVDARKDAPRYLTEPLEVGRGHFSAHHVVDDDGNVWVLLSDQGKLLRVRAP
ncbi:MAG: hypothetical protein HY791_34580 [Deltaproteobacteria bacterium]|nr:hypothetical protein [Deltaproteobacteria bacterium]